MKFEHQFRPGDKVRAIGTTGPIMTILGIEKTVVTVSGKAKHPPFVLRVPVAKIETAPTEVWQARSLGDF